MKKTTRTICIFLTATIVFCRQAPLANATTRYVSLSGLHELPFTNWLGAATNIQAAIDVSVQGDSVVVTTGFYSVTSELLISNAIIFCGSGSARHDTILSAVGNTRLIRVLESALGTVVDGFSLLNGNPNDGNGGGAILLHDTAVVRNCLIQSNQVAAAGMRGGGIYVGSGETLIENCIILDNYAANDGGGISAWSRTAIYRGCLIAHNHAGFSAGGILCDRGGAVDNCTIVNNTGSADGGLLASSDSPVYNCIIYSNSPSNCRTGILYNSCTTPSSGVSCVTAYPEFVSIANRDYHLQPTSPCLDTGFYVGWMGPAYDLDYQPRVMNSVVDMGAYERGDEIRMLIRDNHEPFIEWNSASNYDYQVQVVSRIVTNLWDNSGEMIPGNGIPLRTTVDTSELTKAFRVSRTNSP